MVRTPTNTEILEAAHAVGVPVTSGQAEVARVHLECVLEARNSLNLISNRTAGDALRVHVVDSIAAARVIGRCATLVDIGSGAGFPGIPLAAAVGARAVLVESRAKRVDFLGSTLQRLAELGFEGIVEHGRAEDPAIVERNRGAEVVTMRAVAQLSTLVELAAPYLGPGGRLVALKGPIEAEELTRGDRAAELCGLGSRMVDEYLLPGGDEQRSLVVYEYVGSPEVNLPRRDGKAEKSPLG